MLLYKIYVILYLAGYRMISNGSLVIPSVCCWWRSVQSAGLVTVAGFTVTFRQNYTWSIDITIPCDKQHSWIDKNCVINAVCNFVKHLLANSVVNYNNVLFFW